MEQRKIQLLATDPRTLWTPAQLPGVLHWWRADLGITEAAGQVTQWVDQVNGKILAQPTGANQPDYLASEALMNGQAALEFTQLDNTFMSSSGVAYTPGDEMTMIIVMRTKNLAGFPSQVFLEAGLQATANMTIGADGSVPYNYYSFAYGFESPVSIIDTSTNDDVLDYVGITYDSTGLLNGFNKDSYTAASNPQSNIAVDSFNTLYLGRYESGIYADGYVSEVIFTKSYLREQDLNELADYMQFRYGVSTAWTVSSLVDEKVYLDTYDESPLLLNFQIDDYQELPAINSDFSRTFRIPATGTNNKFFESAFNINNTDYDVSKKVPCDIIVDGEFFRRGQIRLNRIFTNEFSDRTDYEIFFLGESKDFASQIGEGFLNSLLCFDLSHELLMSNIVTSWNASPGTTNGLLDGNVVYPLIDYGYIYDDSGNILQSGSVANSTIDKPFTNSSNPVNRIQFKPWIRTKYLVDKMFALTDYTYTSNFFDSTFFDGLYCNATGNTALATLADETGSDLFEVSTTSWVFTASPSNLIQEIRFENGAFIDPGNTIPTGQRFFPNNGGLHTFYFKVFLTNVYTSSPGTAPTFTFYVYRNGVSEALTSTGTFPPANGEVNWVAGTGNIPYSNTPGAPGFYALDGNYYYEMQDGSGGYGIEGYFSLDLNDGDYVVLAAKYTGTTPISFAVEGAPNGSGVDSESIWECQSFILDITNPCDLLQDNIKIIDFFKSLINKFKLVVAPDPENAYNLIIEPYDDYIGSGVVRDWTHLLDTNYDYEISPIFFSNTATIKFFDQPDADKYNQLNLDKFKEPYGQYIYDSAQELLNGNRDVTGVFSPTLLSNIAGIADGTHFILPRLIVEEPDNNLPNSQYAKVNPIRPNLRLCHYNGIESTSGVTWYYEDDSAAAVGATGYALMSPYTEWPTTANTVNLNYEKEAGYWTNEAGFNSFNGIGIYDEYWSNFIDSQYSPFARKFVGRFILDHEVIRNFQFKDVIFIKDAYYRVLKIQDMPLGDEASVKVELLKLLDYVPVVTPAPVASFTWEWDEANNRVQFTDTSSNSPTSWLWTFSAGTPSSTTAQNPTLTGVLFDTITVTLTATNAGGSDLDSQTFQVVPVQFTNAQHWWRADEGITLNGSDVSAWTDQISSLNLQQSTAVNQPLYTTSATLNSKEVVNPDGVSEFLFTLTSPNSFLGQDRMWLAVLNIPSAPAGDGIAFGDTFLVTAGNGRNWVDGLSGNFRSFDQGLSTAGSLGTNIESPMTTGAKAFITRYDSSAGDYFFALNTLTETTKGTTGLTGQDYPSGTTVAVGAAQRSTNPAAGVFGGRYIQMEIAELVCINDSPDAATMTAWKDYVNTRYGTIIT